MKSLESRLKYFDSLLEPYANQPIDINDDDWQGVLRRMPNPVDTLSIRAEVENLIQDLIVKYSSVSS